MSTMTIPYGVSVDGLIDVIAAWHRTKGYINPLKNVEVAERITSDAKIESKTKTVSNQSSFLIQIGLLEKKGNQSQLTMMGHEIARLADYSVANEFNQKMKEELLDWKEGYPIFEFLFFRDSVDRTEFVERIVADAGKSMDTTNASMGGEALVSLLERVGLVETDSQQIVSLSKDIKESIKGINLSLKAPQIVASKETSDDIANLKIDVRITIEGNLESPENIILINRLKRILEELQYGLIDDDRSN